MQDENKHWHHDKNGNERSSEASVLWMIGQVDPGNASNGRTSLLHRWAQTASKAFGMK